MDFPRTLRVAGSLIFLVGIFAYIQPWNYMNSLVQASGGLIFLSLMGIGSSLVVNTLGYALLLRQHRISFHKMWGYTTSSWSVESLTPGKLGAFALAHYIQKSGVPASEGGGVVLAYRFMLGMVTLVLALIGGTLLFATSISFSFLEWGSIILVIGIVLGLFGKKLLIAILSFLPRDIQKKFLDTWSHARSAFTRENIFMLLGITLLQLGILAGIYWLMFLHAGYDPGYWHVLVATSIVQMAVLIPISINGIGIRESVFGILLAQVGIPLHATIGISLLNTAVGYGVLALLMIGKTGKWALRR